MQKLYCYVDENGQDTRGALFVVAIVLTDEDREQLLDLCEQLEQTSGKGKTKWGKSKYKARLDYLRLVIADRRFKGVLRYSVFRQTTDYDLATIIAIAKSIHWHEPEEPYTTNIYIDGLAKAKRPEYSRELRGLGVPTHKLRGVIKDENNVLIRLADSLAGFIRDALTGGNEELQTLLKRGKRNGVVIEV